MDSEQNFMDAGAGPLVSVLMSCRNAEQFLHDSVESILNQSFSDFEFVIVDDGSTDRTLSILHEFKALDRRIQVIEQEPLGLAAGLNAGGAVCRGEFIARMDADDIARPQRLARQTAFLKEHGEFSGVGSWIQLINKHGTVQGVKEYPDWNVIQECGHVTGWFGSNPFAHPTMMLRRSALDTVGWYRSAFKHAQDADLWRRLFDLGNKLTNVQDVLLDYRIHESNISSIKALNQRAGVLRAALSQRMRHAGHSDLFEEELSLPDEAVVARWDDFPREVRAPIRVRWVLALGRFGNASDMARLKLELTGAVADAGWDSRFTAVLRQSCLKSLRRGRLRDAVGLLRMLLPRDRLGTILWLVDIGIAGLLRRWLVGESLRTQDEVVDEQSDEAAQ